MGKIYFVSNDGHQNTFTDYVLSSKSKGVFNSKLKPLYTTLSHYIQSIKLSGYRIGIKIGTDLLAVEQSNYMRKIVNVDIGFLANKILLIISNLKIAYLEQLIY